MSKVILDLNEHITKNFTWKEAVVSDSYPELASKIVITPQHQIKVFYLFRPLQRVRDRFELPINTLSCIRTEELNNLIGGVPGSDHLFEGYSAAVDFTFLCDNSILPDKLEACFSWIKNTMPYSFGQLILYRERNFIHFSLPTPKHYGEAFLK